MGQRCYCFTGNYKPEIRNNFVVVIKNKKDEKYLFKTKGPSKKIAESVGLKDCKSKHSRVVTFIIQVGSLWGIMKKILLIFFSLSLFLNIPTESNTLTIQKNRVIKTKGDVFISGHTNGSLVI